MRMFELHTKLHVHAPNIRCRQRTLSGINIRKKYQLQYRPSVETTNKTVFTAALIVLMRYLKRLLIYFLKIVSQ